MKASIFFIFVTFFVTIAIAYPNVPGYNVEVPCSAKNSMDTSQDTCLSCSHSCGYIKKMGKHFLTYCEPKLCYRHQCVCRPHTLYDEATKECINYKHCFP